MYAGARPRPSYSIIEISLAGFSGLEQQFEPHPQPLNPLPPGFWQVGGGIKWDREGGREGGREL